MTLQSYNTKYPFECSFCHIGKKILHRELTYILGALLGHVIYNTKYPFECSFCHIGKKILHRELTDILGGLLGHVMKIFVIFADNKQAT